MEIILKFKFHTVFFFYTFCTVVAISIIIFAEDLIGWEAVTLTKLKPTWWNNFTSSLCNNIMQVTGIYP